MSYLQRLRDAKSIHDLAGILGFKPNRLAYIIYKLPPGSKYSEFKRPKRDGGHRIILSPEPRLKLLQRRLANLLYDCVDEIHNGNRRSFAHGFEKGRSIVTNAALHKRRRYVLNIDIEDFFPSFNFGRVRGYFIKDRCFSLEPAVATIIAQIACHENQLPQGSPCSPIISNLISHILDLRLARFAKQHRCTYSRYADDLTFSTNRKDFPAELAAAVPGAPALWELGESLIGEINRAGFQISHRKTRMQRRGSRQVVT